MSKKKYLENPTKYSALSYWKSKNFKVPDNMKIVNDKYFSKDLLKDFNDDIYFKLVGENLSKAGASKRGGKERAGGGETEGRGKNGEKESSRNDCLIPHLNSRTCRRRLLLFQNIKACA